MTISPDVLDDLSLFKEWIMDKQPHIVKSFENEIDTLNETIATMATACCDQMAAMKKALLNGDPHIADKVVTGDWYINDLQLKIEQSAVQILARRQPLAQDLRHILTAMKISHELERIGDYAANVAKQWALLSKTPSAGSMKMIIEMVDVAGDMLRESIDAFLNFNIQKAMDVWHQDDKIDAIYASLMLFVKSEMAGGGESIECGTQLISMARCCERTGDHITNIAEEIFYMATGDNFSSHDSYEGA